MNFPLGIKGRECVGSTVIFIPTRGFGQPLGYGGNITVLLARYKDGAFETSPGTTIRIGEADHPILTVGGNPRMRDWWVTVADPAQVPWKGRTKQIWGTAKNN